MHFACHQKPSADFPGPCVGPPACPTTLHNQTGKKRVTQLLACLSGASRGWESTQIQLPRAHATVWGGGVREGKKRESKACETGFSLVT